MSDTKLISCSCMAGADVLTGQVSIRILKKQRLSFFLIYFFYFDHLNNYTVSPVTLPVVNSQIINIQYLMHRCWLMTWASAVMSLQTCRDMTESDVFASINVFVWNALFSENAGWCDKQFFILIAKSSVKEKRFLKVKCRAGSHSAALWMLP